MKYQQYFRPLKVTSKKAAREMNRQFGMPIGWRIPQPEDPHIIDRPWTTFRVNLNINKERLRKAGVRGQFVMATDWQARHAKPFTPKQLAEAFDL